MENLNKLEAHRSGYPRYTALLSAHDSFFVCRGFSQLRARLLLLKQDKLVMIEQSLSELDSRETNLLSLGKSRCDHEERKLLLSKADLLLENYDRFIERSHRTLSLRHAQQKDIESLQNWIDGTGCIAREETAYLRHSRDLISLCPSRDSATTQVEAWVEKRLRSLGYRPRKTKQCGIFSSDPNVYLYVDSWTKVIARVILLLLITLLLLIPVIVCNIITSNVIRIAIVTMSTMTYLLILSALTKSRTMELVLAAATYATVLIVFVSGTGNAKS